METVFNKFKGTTIVHKGYTGVLCGYNNEHFILAIKASSSSYGFRKLPKESFVMEEYKDVKYKYVYEDETQLIKQFKDESSEDKI
jgi:hypothetical protein